MNTRRLTLLSILLALSVVLNIVERVLMQGITALAGPLLAPLLGVGGLRIGLANIVVLLILYTYGKKDSFVVLILRVILVGLLYTGISSVPFYTSLVGGLLAFTMMNIFKLLPGFSIISVSIMGAIGHVVGQMFVAFLFFDYYIAAYFPLMLLLSLPSGFIIGKLTIKLLAILKPLIVSEV